MAVDAVIQAREESLSPAHGLRRVACGLQCVMGWALEEEMIEARACLGLTDGDTNR